MNKLNRLIRSDGFNNAMSSIFAILIGLAFGFIILLISISSVLGGNKSEALAPNL